jgi:hypothetical protein
MKMINPSEGYYKCGPGHVCVLNSDYKAQTYNKENLEFAHFCILEKIDEFNDPTKIHNKVCDFNNTLQMPILVPKQTDKK